MVIRIIDSFNFIYLYLYLFLINISLSYSNILNKILVFDSKHYRAGHFAFNKNGDMVIEYSYKNFRLFYGLKSNGKEYFKDDNDNNTYIKEIVIGNDTENVRYESRNIFISLNNDDNEQYLFSTGTDLSITELHNLEKNSSIYISTTTFFGQKIYSYSFSLFAIESKKLYYIIFLSDTSNTNKNCIINALSFSGYDLSSSAIKKTNTITINLINRIVNSFLMNEKIVIFYLNNNQKYAINIYNFDLEIINENIIISDGAYHSGYGIFYKGIHIKNELMAFIYFKQNDYSSLELKIGKLDSSENFETNFIQSFSSYYFLNGDLLNDLVKINDERFAYIGISNDKIYFYIILFDLYGDYSYLKIRIYKLTLSNYKINKEFAADIYNNYLILSSTVISSSETQSENNDDVRFSILIFFGYVNGTDNIIDILEYLKDEYIIISINNNFNLVNKITKNIQIDNNIFGYEVLTEQIKLSSIPEEIIFYNNSNSNIKLTNNSILDINYNLIQNINVDKNDNYYQLNYQIIIQEPDYDKFNNLTTDIINYISSSGSFVDQKNYYKQKYLYGRTNTLKFKLCYEYCATCKKIGFLINDQKCEKCLDKYDYYYYNDPANCVEKGHFIDKELGIKVECNNTNSKFYIDLQTGKRICFKYNYQCPEIYPYLNTTSNECHNRGFQCTYIELLNKLCTFLEYNNTEIYYKIINEVLRTYPIDNGESLVIEGKENYIFQLTTGENELDSINGNYENKLNLSMIDLNKCEELLKAHYGIAESVSLIFLKFEKLTTIAAEKNVQYEVYEPVNKTKLDLSICKNAVIDLYLPISLSEKTQNLYENLKDSGYDLFNMNDSFYTDICAKYKTENGTDVLLSDRKLDYFTNETTCQANCQYSNYSSNSQYLKCECNAMEEKIATVNMDKLNGKIFLESFYEVLKYSNYRVIKCYKLVFNSNAFSKNIGSIVVLIYVVGYIPFLCLYIIKGLSPLAIDKIKSVPKTSINNPKNNNHKNSNKSNEKFMNNNINENTTHTKKKKDKHHRKNKNPIINFPPRKKEELSKTHFLKSNSHTIIERKKIKSKTKKEKIDKQLIYSSQNISRNNKSISTKRNILKANKNEIQIFNTKINKTKIPKEKENLDDFQLNNLEYLEAIELDKRPFSQTYWTLLKRNQLILFTFFSWNDYNLKYIKFARFIFLVCTDMAMNVIFFTDDSMHKIYLNYGKYDFIQQIPQIIYSTIVSQAIELFLGYLCFTDKPIYHIIELKKQKNKQDDISKILKCIKIKIIGFFVFISVFFCFYWYLISCFCAVYENTQIIFIKDSISCFISGLLYPFVLYLCSAALRMVALKDEKKRYKCIYNFSDIFPIF